MTGIVKGRQVRVEVAATYGTAKTISAVSKASPGVASSTAHAMANGTIGYFDGVTGMDELEGQVASVADQTTDAFDIEKLNTTSFGTFTAGEFVPVATWVTLSKSTSYEIGGGAAEKTDDTTLLDAMKKEGVGALAAQNVTISGFAESYNSAAADLVEAAALAGADIVVRITLKDGSRRLVRGVPSLMGESVSVGANGTGSFEITTKGLVMKLPPVA